MALGDIPGGWSGIVIPSVENSRIHCATIKVHERQAYGCTSRGSLGTIIKVDYHSAHAARVAIIKGNDHGPNKNQGDRWARNNGQVLINNQKNG
jgi:hypothetical protein